ncbi:unnamed protein product [Fusarium graminearum]|nr:unnamed protein product [Fusarium graminearum]
MGSQDPPASLGANGAEPPVLPVASSDLSSIFEWAALFPLAIYLASSRYPHLLVGRTALAGFIPVGLFPRLRVLAMIADLLQHGQDFIDRASSVTDSRRTVWDVSWDSIFPCANGAVAEILSGYILRNVKLQSLEEKEEEKPEIKTSNKEPAARLSKSKTDKSFRRYQNLHIIRFSESQSKSMRRNRRLGSSDALPMVFEAFVLLGLLGASIVCYLFGLYGTGTAIALIVIFRVCRQLIRVDRPEGYLQSNEIGVPGWFESPLGGWKAHGLRILEILQLAIMTYVAAQKGWDGVALLILVATAWAFDSIVYRDGRIAELGWGAMFTGRTPMIGAIQALGQHRRTSWMDGILAPSNRRDAWLQMLAEREVDPKLNQVLTHDDKNWIELNLRLTREAEEVIRPVMSDQITETTAQATA